MIAFMSSNALRYLEMHYKIRFIRSNMNKTWHNKIQHTQKICEYYKCKYKYINEP